MNIKKYLNEQAQEGDIIGTTNLSLTSATIKSETWKYHLDVPRARVAFRQDLSSHTVVLIRGLDGRWWFSEMKRTRKQVRYFSRKTREWIDETEFRKRVAAHLTGEWVRVEIKSGLVLTDPMHYDHGGILPHVCWIGRHPQLADTTLRFTFNEMCFDAWRIGRKYDKREILEFPPWLRRLLRKDELGTPWDWICSGYPKEIYEELGMPYPVEWRERCSPMSHQIWSGYECVYRMKR